MQNIWLERYRDKKHTFEIGKNAIFRVGPVIVKIIENNRQKLVIDLGNSLNLDMIELSYISKEVNINKNRTYYGRLRTFSKNKEIKVIKMEVITGIQMSFIGSNLYIELNYV